MINTLHLQDEERDSVRCLLGLDAVSAQDI